jgi:hypothetical protein
MKTGPDEKFSFDSFEQRLTCVTGRIGLTGNEIDPLSVSYCHSVVPEVLLVESKSCVLNGTESSSQIIAKSSWRLQVNEALVFDVHVPGLVSTAIMAGTV